MKKSGWIIITSGTGPIECRQAVSGISQKFREEFKSSRNLDVNLDSNDAPLSQIISIENEDFQSLSTWLGTLEWIAKLRSKNSRSRWFVSCVFFEELKIENTSIDPKDLVFESMKASGPGGQHVNKTESAVRLTHKPSGIVVTAREERSQHRNKSLALTKLVNILKQDQNSKASNRNKDIWKSHNNLVRGNALKSFYGENFELKA